MNLFEVYCDGCDWETDPCNCNIGPKSWGGDFIASYKEDGTYCIEWTRHEGQSHHLNHIYYVVYKRVIRCFLNIYYMLTGQSEKVKQKPFNKIEFVGAPL